MIFWFEKHNKISWMITIIGAILIFYISSLTFEASSGGINIFSILYHILAFFCFSFFLFISLLNGRKNYLLFVFGMLVSLIYGFFDEFHQLFVPGRYFSIFDIFLDFVGILFAFMIYLIVFLSRKRKND
jgi:VanZ family protein